MDKALGDASLKERGKKDQREWLDQFSDVLTLFRTQNPIKSQGYLGC